MRVLIIGSLAGELGRAARIAIARGAKLDQADNADAALARLRSDARVDLVLCDVVHNVGAVVRALAAERIAVPVVACGTGDDAEVRAIVRAVLPALTQQPTITVRAQPHTARALEQEFARLDPDLAAHVQAVDCDAMSPGDVRIAWHNGTATRDAAALWQQVAAVLAPAGLLRADAAIRETVNGV